MTETTLSAEELATLQRIHPLWSHETTTGHRETCNVFPCLINRHIAALTTENATLKAALEMREDIAQFLFARLDDIDTASDVAKLDDVAYRRIVERILRRRFEVASTDGYTVTWLAGKEAQSG